MTSSKAQTHACGRTDRRRPNRKGFTLTEIMLSLGIMCIGLVMVAAAFHAGIKRHDDTVDDIVRTLIGENAVAIAKARLRHTNSTSSTYYISQDATFLTGSAQSAGGQALIGSYDLMYPIRVARGRGYVIMGQRLYANRNEYEFRVLPYVCDDPNHHVEVTASGRTWSFSIDAAKNVHKIMASSTTEAKTVFPVDTQVMAVVPDKGLVSAKVTGYTSRYALLDKLMHPTASFSSKIISMTLKDINGNKGIVANPPGFEVADMKDAFVARTALTPAQE